MKPITATEMACFGLTQFHALCVWVGGHGLRLYDIQLVSATEMACFGLTQFHALCVWVGGHGLRLYDIQLVSFTDNMKLPNTALEFKSTK